MKPILITLAALHLPLVHAGTTEAESDIFIFDTRDSVGTTDAESGIFSMDVRGLGNAGTGGSAAFVLNTLGGAPTNLEIVGSSSVAAGSETDYKVVWHAGNSDIDVTSGARWRFLTGAPGNTGMVPPRFYAGETTVEATVKIVASYLTITGSSQETPPFTITITPRMRANLAATRQGNSGLVNFTTDVQGASGAVTVNWDLDRDGQFDDATGATVTRDYGIWTGSTKVMVEVIDGHGNRRVEERDVVLNKPPVANQPVCLPPHDPEGFSLFLPDINSSPFLFDPERRDSGLVVIVHGLYSDAKQPWIKEMGAGVANRCGNLSMTPPNIALMDWSETAGNPSGVTPAQKLWIEGMFRAGVVNCNVPLASAAVSAEALKIGVDTISIRSAGLAKGQHLADWIYQNSRSGSYIDANRPIHLIGHSAGGFVVGEASNILKHLPESDRVYVDRVTMLDTPFVVKEHIASGPKGFPDPGTVERYVSSVWGSLAWGWFVWTNTHYRYENIWTSVTPGYNLISHGDAHDWYTRTAWKAGDPVAELRTEGFHYSPIINAGTRISKPYAPPQAMPPPDDPPAPAPPLYPDIVPTGWETFGNANESADIWTLTELDDAGIWKQMALPITAATLAFEFHFLTAGDGDFLAVHFGDDPALYQGLDLPLSRDAWIPAEIPLEAVPELDGKLVFTLVSRGDVNAQVQLRNIRITQAEDVDGDGLAVTEEISAGSDACNSDTDGDGISDGNEVNSYGTDPLRADTDGDGQSDAAELAAGTNSLANGSVFRVTSLTRTPQGGMALQWTGAAGKSYRVLRSLELGTGNYETLAFGIPGAAPFTTYTDPNPPPPRAFYWIEVE